MRHFAKEAVRAVTKLAIVLMVVTVCACVAFAAATGPGPTTAPIAGSGAKPFKVGFAFAQTGYLAGADRHTLHGALMAAEYINAKGGINGRKLETYVEDMKSQPADGAAVVMKMVVQQGVKAVLGGFASAAAEAESPIVAERNVPLLVYCLLPKNAQTVFSFITPPNFNMDAAFQFLKSKGISDIGLLYNPSPYNKALFRIATNQAKNAGVNIVDAEEHAVDATSLAVQLTKIKDKKTQAVMTLTSGSSNLLAGKDMKALGMSIPLLLAGGDEVAVMRDVAANFENTYALASGVQTYPDVNPAQKPAADIFVPLWKQKHPDRDPGNAGVGWDMVFTLAQVIPANDADDGKLVSGIENLTYTGASNTYKFSADNHNGVRSTPWKVVQFPGGTMKVVFSPK
jgi:branched-chain amino acid transport system substrate-binding protein